MEILEFFPISSFQNIEIFSDFPVRKYPNFQLEFFRFSSWKILEFFRFLVFKILKIFRFSNWEVSEFSVGIFSIFQLENIRFFSQNFSGILVGKFGYCFWMHVIVIYVFKTGGESAFHIPINKIKGLYTAKMDSDLEFRIQNSDLEFRIWIQNRIRSPAKFHVEPKSKHKFFTIRTKIGAGSINLCLRYNKLSKRRNRKRRSIISEFGSGSGAGVGVGVRSGFEAGARVGVSGKHL